MKTLKEFLEGIKSADNSAYTLKQIITKLVILLEDLVGDAVKYDTETQTFVIGTKCEIDGTLTVNATEGITIGETTLSEESLIALLELVENK